MSANSERGQDRIRRVIDEVFREYIRESWGDYIETSRLKFLASFQTRCPACGRDGFTFHQYLYDMPRVGKTIITVGRCPHCGYTYRDIRLAESTGRKKIVVIISSEKDLNKIILRASSASIKIPELGLEMKPGPASEGFITTVEGILYRFRDVAEFLCKSAEGKALENCRRVLRDIDAALRGEKQFTLIIEDPEGVSSILDF